jgi:multidrug efflux pump subunit AcrA (membrane-fusion protein)
VLFGAGLGSYALRDLWLTPATGGGGPVVTSVRTFTVSNGNLEKTIRLTGVTTADKFMSITAPQLRGGRGGAVVMSFGGGMRGGMGGGAVQIQIQTGGGGGGGGGGGRSSSSSGSSSDSSSSSSGASSSSGSSSGTSSASSSGFRGSSSNRFGSSSTAKTTSSSSSSSSSSRGSTGAALSSAGTGGGGDFSGMSGGASDFMQVLVSIANNGTMVKKGDVVAEFDPQYQLTRLDDYKSSVDQADRSMRRLDADLEVSRKQRELQLKQAQAAVDKAKLDIQTTPVRSAIEAEQLKLALEEAEAQLKMVKAATPYADTSERASRRNSELDIETSRIELKRAELNIDRMKMRAPMDGMVVVQTLQRGPEQQQIKQGDQIFPGMMFMQIVDPSSMLVSASINQVDVELLRVGAKARLNFDAYPGLTLPAHVISIGAMTKTGGFRDKFLKEIPVFLKIEKMDSRVIPDLSVSADIIVESSPADRVITPLESVFRDPAAGKSFVYVRTAKGVERRDVRLGLSSNIQAEILEGLRAGEVVLLEEPPSNKPAPPGRSESEGNVQRS